MANWEVARYGSGAAAAAGMFLVACVLSAEGVRAAGAHDGVWNGSAVTGPGGGRCGVNWKLSTTISGGEITGTATFAAEKYELNGTVDADGKLKWQVFGAGASANATGRIEGDRASGNWFDNSRSNCEGDFELSRSR